MKTHTLIEDDEDSDDDDDGDGDGDDDGDDDDDDDEAHHRTLNNVHRTQLRVKQIALR